MKKDGVIFMCLKIDQMKAKKELNIPLGINENGEQEFLDLNKARHVLVAGKTGSGKSTFSRELNKITGIPLYHLDNMYWNIDKTIKKLDIHHI